jgi:hypothetical protein
MKAKLVKTENGYGLEDCDIIAFYSKNRPVHNHYKLSKENCDELFGIVDVEKLAFEHSNDLGGRCSNRAYKSFKEGFNKAMELNKDKLFTLEQMKRIYEKGYSSGRSELNSRESDKVKYDYIQSLQQPKEIEVTFDPEEKDSDGCLILKNKKQ